MRQRVDDPRAIQSARARPFGHQTSPYRKPFRRSQRPLHGGMTSVLEALLVWRWRPFLLFILLFIHLETCATLAKF
jgi:hypothetical protein